MMLYIDPGTGSMLFSLVIGLLSVVWFGVRKLYMRIKYLTPGKVEKNNKDIPLVIYSEGKRYWPVFEPVCRELDARGFDTVYLTSSSDDPAFSASYPHLHAQFIGEGNRAFAKLNFLRAAILLSTTPGLDVYQWKRSKDVKWYVHLPHGANDSTTGYRFFGLDFYDAVMISGTHQEEAMRELEKLRNEPEKEAVIVGVPYMDEMVKRLENSIEQPGHSRTVLVAPTWGASSIFCRFGSAFIDALLSTGYHIILRPHPQSFTSDKELIDRLMQQYPDSSQLEWNRDNDNFDVLRRSDMMISDYSGVIFDYAFVFDKPVICADTEMDTNTLDVCWLESPLWAVSALPKIGPILKKENINGLKEMIDAAIEDNSYSESRHDARDETWMFRGEGAARAADYLIKKYKELAMPEG